MSERVRPLPPDEWPPEMREALAGLRTPNPRHPFPSQDPGRPKGLNVLGLLAHHPALTTAWMTFNGHVQFGTTLSTRQRELLILRVAALRQCDYEWAQHVVLGRDAGLSDDEMAAIASGPDAIEWDPLDRALLTAVDELIARASITDDTWAALSSRLGTQELMDLLFTVGAYETVAMAFNAFGLELDDDLR